MLSGSVSKSRMFCGSVLRVLPRDSCYEAGAVILEKLPNRALSRLHRCEGRILI